MNIKLTDNIPRNKHVFHEKVNKYSMNIQNIFLRRARNVILMIQITDSLVNSRIWSSLFFKRLTVFQGVTNQRKEENIWRFYCGEKYSIPQLQWCEGNTKIDGFTVLRRRQITISRQQESMTRRRQYVCSSQK